LTAGKSDTRNYLPTEMCALIINCIQRDGRSSINDQAGRFQLRPGTNHRYPAIDAQRPWLPVAVANTPATSLTACELHIHIAVHTNDT
jgi:hypothetical protein